MDRRSFLQVSVPTSLGLASGVAKIAQSRPAGLWTLGNEYLRINLSDQTKGGLSGLIDVQSQRNFIVKPGPLYTLSLVRKGQQAIELTSLDAEGVNVTPSSDHTSQTLTFNYGRHRDFDLTVVCRVQVSPDSPLSKWRISVKNNTPYGIRAVRYPIVQAPLVLADSSKDDRFVYPAGGGAMMIDPVGGTHRNYMGKTIGINRRTQYPGGAALQLQAYYDDTAGLYMATHDAGINVKHFGLKRDDDFLDLSIEHNYDERPGLRDGATITLQIRCNGVVPPRQRVAVF